MLTVLPIWLCLLAAHLLGEFVLQPPFLARAKRRWSPWALPAHAGIHGLLGYALLGVARAWPSAVLLALLHNVADIATQAAVAIASRRRQGQAPARVRLAIAAASRGVRLAFLGVVVWLLTDGQGVEPDDLAWLHVAPGGYLEALVLLSGVVLIGPGGAHVADRVVPAAAPQPAPASASSPGDEQSGRPASWLAAGALRRALVCAAAIGPGGAPAGAIAFVGLVWMTRLAGSGGGARDEARAGEGPGDVASRAGRAGAIESRLLVDAAWALSAGLAASAALSQL